MLFCSKGSLPRNCLFHSLELYYFQHNQRERVIDIDHPSPFALERRVTVLEVSGENVLATTHSSSSLLALVQS